MLTRRIAAVLALIAFSFTLVIGGLQTDNSFSTTVLRALAAMGGTFVLGLIAGVPAIAGTLIGVSVTNAELSAMLLGVGVGAIVQVIVQIAPSMRGADGRALDAATAAAVAAGALVFYLTGLLISV